MANLAKLLTKDAVCRLCFGISNDLKEIFSEETNNFAEKILNLLHLKVSESNFRHNFAKGHISIYYNKPYLTRLKTFLIQ